MLVQTAEASNEYFTTEGTLSVGAFNLVATWFPFHDGLFVRGGAGFAFTNAKVELSAGTGGGWDDTYSDGNDWSVEDYQTYEGGVSEDGDLEESASGYGLQAGLGYALGFGGGFHLQAGMDFYTQRYTSGALHDDFGYDDSWFMAMTIGVAGY